MSWKNSGVLAVSSVCENRNSIKKTQPLTIISKLDGRLEQYNHAVEVNYLHMHLYNAVFLVKPVNAPARLHAAAFALIYLHTLLLLPHPVLTFTCSDVYHCYLTAVVNFRHPACPGTSSLSHADTLKHFCSPRVLFSCHLTVRKCVRAPWQMCVLCNQVLLCFYCRVKQVFHMSQITQHFWS